MCLESRPAKHASLAVRVENEYASGKVKRPRGPPSSLTNIRRQVDMQNCAVNYYVNDYLRSGPGLPGILQSLPECFDTWLESRRASPMVDLALSAVALGTFSQTMKHTPSAFAAVTKYQRLLGIVQTQISRVVNNGSEGADFDPGLFTIFLMGRYEMAMFQHSDVLQHTYVSLQDWSHHDGAMAILKVWLDHPLRRPPSVIVEQNRRALLRASLLRGQALPQWFQDGSLFGEDGLELEYDRAYVRLVNFHHAFTEIWQGKALLGNNAQKLNEEAKDLDQEWQRWTLKFLSTWGYRQHDLPQTATWPARHFPTSKICSFAKHEYAAVWCQFLATRMLVINTRLRLLNMVCDLDPPAAAAYDEQRKECRSRLATMMATFVSVVPFSIGRFQVTDDTQDAQPTLIPTTSAEEMKPHLLNLMAWPLTIVSSLVGTDLSHQQWVKGELAHVRRSTGTGIIQHAESDRWCRL